MGPYHSRFTPQPRSIQSKCLVDLTSNVLPIMEHHRHHHSALRLKFLIDLCHPHYQPLLIHASSPFALRDAFYLPLNEEAVMMLLTKDKRRQILESSPRRSTLHPSNQVLHQHGIIIQACVGIVYLMWYAFIPHRCHIKSYHLATDRRSLIGHL